MYKVNNFTDNDDIKVLDKKGAFSVLEYQRDLSVTPDTAMNAYYSAQMNVRKIIKNYITIFFENTI